MHPHQRTRECKPVAVQCAADVPLRHRQRIVINADVGDRELLGCCDGEYACLRRGDDEERAAPIDPQRRMRAGDLNDWCVRRCVGRCLVPVWLVEHNIANQNN